MNGDTVGNAARRAHVTFSSATACCCLLGPLLTCHASLTSWPTLRRLAHGHPSDAHTALAPETMQIALRRRGCRCRWLREFVGNRDSGALPKRKAVCDDLEGRREGRKKGRKQGKNETCFVTLICWNSRNSCEVGLNKAIGGFENWWEALSVILRNLEVGSANEPSFNSR